MTTNADSRTVNYSIKKAAGDKVTLHSDDALLGDFPDVASAHAWVDIWATKKGVEAQWSDQTTAEVTYPSAYDGDEI